MPMTARRVTLMCLIILGACSPRRHGPAAPETCEQDPKSQSWAHRAGFRVEEVPITFSDREVGGSKMTKRIVAEAVWRIPALRFAAVRDRL